MAHQIYTTKAIVCGAYDHNTSDKSFLLFTREAGMLFATARSVREERSKQRPALQEFSYINISLVKGKQGWRVGSVEAVENFFSNAVSRPARSSVVLLIKTLRRFIHGEEATPKLFDFCIQTLTGLSKAVENREFLELLSELKILAELGYVNDKDIPKGLKESNFSQLENYIEQISLDKLKKIIVTAVDNSHL